MKKIWMAIALMFFTAGAAMAAEMPDLGAKAPAFSLPDVVSGKTVSLDDYAGKKALVVMFICQHCPFVKRIKEGLADLGTDYAGQDVGIVAISANDPARSPEDSPSSLKEMAVEEGFTFPLCFDESQAVAKAYGAVCTPDIFVFDENRTLAYHGHFDSARPGNNEPVTGKDVREAVDAILAGEQVNPDQQPPAGCSIKWKK